MRKYFSLQYEKMKIISVVYQGGEVGPGSEDLAGTGQRFGLELRHENIQDLIQVQNRK